MARRTITPYYVNVRDLIHRPGEMQERSLEFAVPSRLGEGLVAVHAGALLQENLRLESMHDGILITGHARTMASGVCGRCLQTIDHDVEVEFCELFAYSSDEAYEYEIYDEHVDLEPSLRDAVILSLPFQPVCQPDCPGLDADTGERLADHPVTAPKNAIDDRWTALLAFDACDHATTNHRR